MNKPLFKESDEGEFSELFDLQKIIHGIQRHLILFVVIISLFGMGGVFTTYKFLKTYQAEAIVIYREGPKDGEKMPAGMGPTNLSMATVMDMILLPRNFEAVRSILGLDIEPEELMMQVSVPPPTKNSKMIRIVAYENNANLAVDIANTLARVAVKTGKDFKQEQLKVALNNYRAQQEVTRITLNNQIQDIENFKKEHNYFQMDPSYSLAIAELETAKTNFNNTDQAYQGLLVEYKNLKREVDFLPEVVPINRDSKDNPLRTRVLSLEAALANALGKYTRENPKIKMIEGELDELRNRVSSLPPEDPTNEFYERNPLKDSLSVELMRMQGKVRSAQKVKEDVAVKVGKLEKELQVIPKQQMDLVRLLNAKQMTEEQLKFLSEAVDSVQLRLNVPKGSIELYYLSKEALPWNNNWWVHLVPLFTMLFGFGFALFMAAIIELADGKFRTSKQVELRYNAPCLLAIPQLPTLRKSNGENITRFYVRELCQQIEKITGQNVVFEQEGKLSITFTSSVDGEGKSTWAYYFARYLGSLDKKVLLLQLDPNGSNKAIPLTPSTTYSFEDYLIGKGKLSDLVVKGKPDLIKISTPMPNMREMIKSERMTGIWEELEDEYDIIIIDAPGVIQEDYASSLARLTDLTLMVVDSSAVSKKFVDESMIILDSSGVRASGIILNRVHPIYIVDERVKRESKSTLKGAFNKLLFWRS